MSQLSEGRRWRAGGRGWARPIRPAKERVEKLGPFPVFHKDFYRRFSALGGVCTIET